MGRYTDEYWDDEFPGEEVLAAVVTAGLSTLMDKPAKRYGCKITDSETGLTGSTDAWMASKHAAHDAAWADLMEKQEGYYQAQKENEHKNAARENFRAFIPKRGIEGDATGLIALVIKGIVYLLLAAAVLWLVFAVALPLVIINAAVISLVIAVAVRSKKATYFYCLCSAEFLFF